PELVIRQPAQEPLDIGARASHADEAGNATLQDGLGKSRLLTSRKSSERAAGRMRLDPAPEPAAERAGQRGATAKERRGAAGRCGDSSTFLALALQRRHRAVGRRKPNHPGGERERALGTTLDRDFLKPVQVEDRDLAMFLAQLQRLVHRGNGPGDVQIGLSVRLVVPGSDAVLGMLEEAPVLADELLDLLPGRKAVEIGRASCRERVRISEHDEYQLKTRVNMTTV